MHIRAPVLKESCNFRDVHGSIEGADAVVLGVSPDDTVSHDRFAEKYNLPFALLADTDHRVAEAYGTAATWGSNAPRS